MSKLTLTKYYLTTDICNTVLIFFSFGVIMEPVCSVMSGWLNLANPCPWFDCQITSLWCHIRFAGSMECQLECGEC